MAVLADTAGSSAWQANELEHVHWAGSLPLVSIVHTRTWYASSEQLAQVSAPLPCHLWDACGQAGLGRET